MIFHLLLGMLVGWINPRQEQLIAYLREENHLLNDAAEVNPPAHGRTTSAERKKHPV